ncbi:PAS domain S-box-containing protein/diguanylate cyclase (GGDEF) domain-containing protein [Rhizobiales bacterium GAS188]|nr:PAS domain S-box-containing protein/diguanylate cyclase (GGDEF) domain-containing protein [Rhizobiales bacterium GAS188]
MPNAMITSRLIVARQRARAFFARAGFGTIRGRILIAFLTMSLITGALGAYATLGISRSGVLVAKTFDESLMSINYARAAAADFAAMQAAFARRWTASDTEMRTALDKRIDALEKSLSEDLEIAAARSQSARAAHAAARVQQAAKSWSDMRRHLLDPRQGLTWDVLDRDSETVNDQIDLLINYTAGDGFTYRQSARAAVVSDIQINLAGTAFAVLLSALLAWLLARRIIGPVAAASKVATRIAQGNLDTVIQPGGADELGALLGAMEIMRNNIAAMMEREVAQRRSAQTRLADALESSREGLVVVDAEGRIALANSQAAEFLGSSPELLRQGTSVKGLVATLAHSVTAGASLLQSDGHLPATGEARLADGRWLRISRSATQEGGYIAVWSDISVLKDQEVKLKATNLRLDAALDNMSQGLCLYDAASRLKVVNRRFCEIFHLEPERVQPGMTLREVLELSIAAGNHVDEDASELFEAETKFINRRSTGTYFQELSQGRVVAVTHQPMAEGGWVATYEDVTERRNSEKRIAFMARHDALTNLPNRVLFGERIEQVLSQMESLRGFAVLCLDLDQFKQVNDTLGHSVGDALLRMVAERLLACVRDVDTVARLGGDEFAIVQCGVLRQDEAAQLAQRIVESVSRPYDLDGHRVTVGVSIGISMAPVDGTLTDKLLKAADVALYRAKADGRGIWRFFEPDMDVRLQARRRLESDLRDAVAKEEFELFYQPIYDLAKNRVAGFEALLRWRHPTRGLLSPAEFMAATEELGLIIPVGEWVLRQACAEASDWPRHVKVAVNVSAEQFKSGHLVQAVTTALVASGLSAKRLELEITETVLLANSEATLATLHKLRSLGVSISMDDFGTGYSSLSYLRSFPFDKIKIDQSFIKDLTTTGGSGAIVRAVTSLGRSLGMRTTAEGVETSEQLAWIRKEGCNEAQGYLFSKPVPQSGIRAVLEKWGGARGWTTQLGLEEVA